MCQTQPPSRRVSSTSVAESNMSVDICVGFRTDVGKKRNRNEDCLGIQFPLFAVADGMGGHQAGEVAACIAIEEMLAIADGQSFVSARQISAAVARAAERVDALSDEPTAPGSTLTGIAFSSYRGYPVARVFNIGDSRTYLLTDDDFLQVTTDHSQIQELIDCGAVTVAEARSLPQRNVITRALGAGSGTDVEADQYMVPLVQGGRFLVCSDGLSGEVTDSLIEMVCRAVDDPQQAANELVNMALAAGGQDNVSVIVLDILSTSPIFDSASGEDITQSREGEITAERWSLDNTVHRPHSRPIAGNFDELKDLHSGEYLAGTELDND